MLSALIEQIHPRKMNQSTLSGEILREEKFNVIGFVPAEVLSFKREVWFSKLVESQIEAVEIYLSNPRSYYLNANPRDNESDSYPWWVQQS